VARVLRRLDARPAAPALTLGRLQLGWFDGALAVGLFGLAAFFPHRFLASLLPVNRANA